MKLRLRAKLLILFLSIIFVYGTLFFLLVQSKVFHLTTRTFTDQLNAVSGMGQLLMDKDYKGNWNVRDGKLYKGEKLIHEETAVLDSIKQQNEALTTIFLGDTRVATNVLKEDGSRAIGTKASPEVINTVLKEGKAYEGEITLFNKLYLCRYIPIKDTSGTIIGMWFAGIEKGHVDEAVKSMTSQIGIGSSVMILISIMILMLFTNGIIKNVDNVLGAIKTAASGDFTAKSTVKSFDEIGLISRNVNLMTENIGALLHAVKEASMTVASSSQEMMASSEESSKVTEQVATAIDEVAKGASEQAASTESGNRQIQGIIGGLEQITGEMNSSKELTQRAREVVEAGGRAVNEQEAKMNESKQLSGNAANAMTDLSDKSREIGQILEVIRGIAEQTNLLALNAAIEAARAGENGKGFAVVAEEIRKLAEQSGLSVKKIAEMTQDIQSGVNKAAIEMSKAAEATLEQSEALLHTVRAFTEIKNVVGSIAGKVDTAAEASNILCQNARTAGDAINSIASIAEQTAAGTEEVAASTEEQASIIYQISDSAGYLAELANELQLKIEKFKI